MRRQAIILAAGKGTRMRSELPKVLHLLAGRPLVRHVVDTAKSFGVDRPILIVGHGAERVQETLNDTSILYANQQEQLGTGHAVKQALPLIEKNSQVVVLYGDVPLVSAELLEGFAQSVGDADLGVLSMQMEEPTGYGRIVKDDAENVLEVVEEKNASEAQKKIKEVNSGIYLVKDHLLTSLIPNLSDDNAQGEYLLTDLIELAVKANFKVVSCQIEDSFSVSGVNNRKQLAELERYYQLRQANDLLESGLALQDPARFDLRGELTFGKDVLIDVNVVLEGSVTLGDDIFIGPNCYLKNVKIESGTRIEAFSHLEDAIVGANCSIGPYARLRPGSKLADQVKIGNFVETKKVEISPHSKVNHLSYVGDALVGESVNIGAGTIFCNYDGVRKHQTLIEDDVFVGSNCSLVAPVKIGKGATIAAGSTISQDAPSGKLSLARSRQVTHPEWRRPIKDQ